MSVATNIRQGLLYKAWKLKQVRAPAVGGLGMVSMSYPEIFDLTIVGTLLRSNREAPDIFHIEYYELINDSIVMVMPGWEKGQVEFKISELTEKALKLIMHLKMDDEPHSVDTDVVVFGFEVE
jgi:hypothetical protein